MTLVKNKYGVWEADLTDRAHGRLHLSLATKRKDEGARRHSALEIFLRQAEPELVEDLRKRRINIAAVEACVREQRPFASLRVELAWPALGEAVERYLAWMEANPNRAQNTHTQSKHYLTRAVEFFGADVRVDRITGEQVDAWTATLRTMVSPITKRPLSAWSVSLHLQKLGALYTWLGRQESRRAIEAKRLPRTLHSPIDRDLITNHGGGRVRFLSEEEAARLVAAAPDQYRLGILLGLLCGLRLGEVTHLRPPPHDLDLDQRHLTVQPKDGWRVKTGKGRSLPIPDELIPVAERHLARYASESWVFPSPFNPGVPITEHAFGQTFRRVAKDAGLQTDRTDPLKVTFHTLRHTFASWLIMKGHDLFTVAKLMGHASIDQLVDTYGHLSPDHKRRAMAQLGSWLGGLSLMEEPAV